jgi:hypothetical protein
MANYKQRETAAKGCDRDEMYSREEIKKIRRANAVVGSAIHPETGKIIPCWMRMSSFLIFKVPLLFTALFFRNQTPLFNAGV